MRVPEAPAPVTIAPDTQLADMVFSDDRVNGDMVLFQRRSAGGWSPVTARRFAADVRGLADGFLAAGIQPGDRVALPAATSYEWTVVDYALWAVAALPVPIYETSSAEQVRWVLEDAGPVAVVAGNETQRRLVEEAAASLSSGPPRVWQIDGGGLDRLREGGHGVSDAQLRERRRMVSADDLATIIYTSGATGRPKGCMLGTVGPPLPGVEIRIADDGEILIKGPMVFQGYWRNEQVTRQSLTADGFLRTGDVGALDEDGFLTISGRKKEIIVTAGGKNLAPEPLEDRLRTHPLISQAVVVGDRRPYTAALIALDAAALASWKRAAGKPEQAGPADLRDDPDLLARLQTAVDEANTTVSRAESIRRIRILAVDLTEQNGYLTPTLKVKRALVHKDFRADIEELYR
ncbi:AMP-binding protein [Nonomuraea sp. NPDC004580]|uniref:AMP-dependent synthetase/ligase n=1 Tax=Nonomuraea sp. NPDC004580 TaxID=3154552 RepID=UPI0033B8C487